MIDIASILKWALLAFLCFSELAIITMFLVNAYKYFKSGKDKLLLRRIFIFAILGITVGYLLFHFYGKHFFYQEIALSIVLFLFMLVNLTKWNPLRRQ